MIKQQIQSALKESLNQLGEKDTAIDIVHPDQESHGDFATSVALQLGKKLGKSPLEVADDIVRKLSKLDFVSKVEVASPGFINFFLDINWLTNISLKNIIEQEGVFGNCNLGNNKKVIVEHTSVNPNKAMHVGNLRNAILGDSIARLLRKCGYQVEVENYIDDTGAQVADTTTAVLYLNKKQPEGQSFDEFCWDIYTEINQLYETKPEFVEKKREVSKMIEEGNNKVGDLAKEISDKVVQCHLEQMAKFGVLYDLLIYESDILKFGFWEQAFKQLKKSPNFVYQTLGEQKDCWVLKYESDSGGNKIFVRSNGTKVYTAKDTAYHLWKFGLLEKDFLYEKWPTKIDSKTVWKTSEKGKSKDEFGHGEKILNVIDERQTYPQEMVKLALKNLGFRKQADNYYHLAYGVVYLSPQTAKELGVDTSEGKAFYAMAGRKGIGVKVSDLIKLLTNKIEGEKHSKESTGGDKKASILEIAIGAIRYYMLKYNHNSPIIFDYEQALSLYGNTGVYLQYSHARASGIIRKAGKFVPSFGEKGNFNESEATMIKLLSYWPEVVSNSAENLSISEIADYAFKISSHFHNFYEANPVLKSKKQLREFRLTLVLAYKIIIADTLSVLGIFAPERI